MDFMTLLSVDKHKDNLSQVWQPTVMD